MREPKLKPCPFCGGEALYGRGGEPWEAERMWNAGCIKGHAISPDQDTQKQAADWWNRRQRATRRTETKP